MKKTAEMFLCDYFGCTRENLQNEISTKPTKVIWAIEKICVPIVNKVIDFYGMESDIKYLNLEDFMNKVIQVANTKEVKWKKKN